MTRVLRWLVVPFVAIYVVLAGLSVGHAHAAPRPTGVTWQLWTAGLAFTIALSGLGWTENGNDYSRYLPPTVSRRSVVGWLFVGTALPEIALMTLGAVVFSFVGTGSLLGRRVPLQRVPRPARAPGMVRRRVHGLRRRPAVRDQQPRPVLLGRHAPGDGARIRRYHAVLLDSAICLGITVLRRLQLPVLHAARATSSRS